MHRPSRATGLCVNVPLWGRLAVLGSRCTGQPRGERRSSARRRGRPVRSSWRRPRHSDLDRAQQSPPTSRIHQRRARHGCGRRSHRLGHHGNQSSPTRLKADSHSKQNCRIAGGSLGQGLRCRPPLRTRARERSVGDRGASAIGTSRAAVRPGALRSPTPLASGRYGRLPCRTVMPVSSDRPAVDEGGSVRSEELVSS